MKILCTGGAGYVGGACLRWLLRNGHDPIAFDNLSVGHTAAVPDPDKRLVRGDIADRDALTAAMTEHNIEGVMHFAASASVPESIEDPDLYYRQNVIGTKNVLDAMLQCGIKRLVFSSTAATYAFTDKMPLTEESEQQPQVPYGTTKLAAEWMIRDYRKAYGIGFAIMRYFNACGADADGQFGEDRDHETHLIPLALQAAVGRRDHLKIYGHDYPTPDGTCVRDYIHNDDLAQAHQLALEVLKPGDERVYNLGSGTGVSVAEVLAACEKVVGQPINQQRVDRRPGDPAVLVATPKKISAELGWKPQYTQIEQIVETAWRWHHAYPNGYKDRKPQPVS